jgi:pSer/pThr/pTyr-binding forkhead associated (FHA) protein
VVRGLSVAGRQFPLFEGLNGVGRSAQISFPEDPYVGARHASLFFRGEGLVVQDEGAANGVYVKLRGPHRLETGDLFVVGERLLRFGGVQALAPALTPPRHGSPRAAERMLVLEEVLEGGGTGRVCRRAGPIVTIGRSGCDLNFPSDGFVSARHAELSLAGETAFLRDLGSANGSFVRVPSRTERTLVHGDYLLLGRELLRVEFSTGP